MKTSEAGMALIKSFESLRLDAYVDPVGVWTIGWGCINKGVAFEGMQITEKGAQALFLRDLKDKEEDVLNSVKIPLLQNEFDALVSWTFNLGVGNLSTSTMLKKLNAGDKEAAAEEMLRWNKGRVRGQLVVMDGLVRRRNAERALFLG